MRRLMWLTGVTAVSLLLVTQSAFAAADNACTADEVARGKATICHVPPGNPANPSTLCVGVAAVPAHLANHPGDSAGACANPCPNGCDDANNCTADSCQSDGCHNDPIGGCCLSDADCAPATVCTGAETCDLTTNTCTPGAAVNCDDNNSCTDDSCDPNATTPGCQNEDNGTCCCQQLVHPDCGGGDEANHCFQGCAGCNGTCIPASQCLAGGPPAPPASTCTGFCGF